MLSLLAFYARICYTVHEFAKGVNILMVTAFKESEWIFRGSSDSINQYADFLTEFNIESVKEDIYIKLSCDSQYSLYINGRFADCGQYADYSFYKVYDRINITPYISKGKNNIKITVNYIGEDCSTYRKGEPGLIFEVMQGEKILCASTTETLSAANPNYLSGDVERLTSQLSFSFKYDANKPENNQKLEKSVGINKSRSLFERKTKKLKIDGYKKALILSQGVFKSSDVDSSLGGSVQYDYLSFRELSSLCDKHPPIYLPSAEGIKFKADDGDGIYLVIDLLNEDTGFFTLDMDLPGNTRIEAGYGEHLDDLRVRSVVGGRHFACEYTAKQGRQGFTHYFKRFGLRYLQLHIYSSEFTIYYAGILPAHYPVSDIPYFSCADKLHNKIYDVSVRTLLLCMHEHYEDCPWREQALYSMDSRNQMLCGYYAFGEYEMPRESLRLMALSLREDGMLELCSPAKIGITIPSFSAVFIVALYEYLLYSGDLEFVREAMPVAKKIADTFIEKTEDNGLIPNFTDTPYWNFYEWQDGLDGGDIFRDYIKDKTFDAPLNAFVSLALNALSMIYKMSGDNESFEYYKNLKDSLNKNIDKHFWDNSKNAYCSFTEKDKKYHFAELTQSLIICCGACPDDKLDALLEKLKGDTLLPITLSYSIFKYEAFMKKPESYAKYVFDDISKIWGDMLFAGATTFWETQKGAWDFDNAGSLCHGWSAVPVYFYFAYALGLKPDADKPVSFNISALNCGLYDTHGKFLAYNKNIINL